MTRRFAFNAHFYALGHLQRVAFFCDFALTGFLLNHAKLMIYTIFIGAVNYFQPHHFLGEFGWILAIFSDLGDL